MSFSELISPLVGRLVLAWFFLTSSFSYGAQWHATITLMALKDLPVPALYMSMAPRVATLHSNWLTSNLQPAPVLPRFSRA